MLGSYQRWREEEGGGAAHGIRTLLVQRMRGCACAPAARCYMLARLHLQVEDLARISFKRAPLYVGVDDGRSVATREGLEQVC